MERHGVAYYAVMAWYLDNIMETARFISYLNCKYGIYYCPNHGWEMTQ